MNSEYIWRPNPNIQPVGYDNHYVYVSGNFLNAGGGPSTYFGRWRRVIDLYLPVVKR
jgi:hypothetical protein